MDRVRRDTRQTVMSSMSIANESGIQHLPFSHLVKMERENSSKSSQVEYKGERKLSRGSYKGEKSKNESFEGRKSQTAHYVVNMQTTVKEDESSDEEDDDDFWAAV